MLREGRMFTADPRFTDWRILQGMKARTCGLVRKADEEFRRARRHFYRTHGAHKLRRRVGWHTELEMCPTAGQIERLRGNES